MWSRRRRAALVLVAAVFLLLIGGRIAAEFVVELLWYRSLELERVFWTLWGAGLGARAAVALPAGLIVFLNLWVVSRSLGTIRVRRRYANIEIAEQLPRAYIYAALVLISLFSAWWISAGMLDPVGALAALRPAAWGMDDPVFNRDLSFYLFRLPLLERLQTLAGLVVFWSALLVTAAYVATGGVRMGEGRPSVSPLARRHLGLLGAAFILVFAWDAWLDRYGLAIAGSGVGGSIGYADLHARLPGKWIVVVLGVAAAAAVAYGAWRGRRREPIAGVVLLVLGIMGTQIIYPALIQKLLVEPNEFPRERPFIERHLEFTRLAFGLSDMRRAPLPFRAAAELDGERVLQRLRGAPLWDERPLMEAFNQRQSLFPYYDFVSVHTDRYGPPGREEQVAVSVRELQPTKLPESAQTWQNLHLTYVKSEGLVVSPTAQMADDGAPVYYLSDLAPPRLAADAPAGLELREPAVFFSERTVGYVILGPEAAPRGIVLDAAWKRLVFAWAFQSRNLFLSGEVTPDSRIVYRRRVVDRARAVAPFLHFPRDGAAVPVVHEGHVVWLVDGFTASSSFPLARSLLFDGRGVRYLRNSVKAVVDGVSGEVRMYAVDPTDPMLRTFQAIFPGLIQPLSDMPAGLRSHLRFSPVLLEAQAQLLGEYHLGDARAFYAKEDVWALATESYRSESVPVRPTFAMLPLPGEDEPEFLLMVPYVARGRQNMTALLVARNDPPHYGEQFLFELRRDEQVPGPQQIEAMIDQDPEISQQLSLWRRGGSDVVRGHLIVVPIDSTLLYVEPIFLVAENAAIPQLERVVLAHSRRVVMRPTLAGAVAALFGVPGLEPEAPAAAEPAPDAGASQTPAAEAELLQRAGRLLEQAEAQLRAGDWAGFGRSWAQLRELLRRSPGPEGGSW